MKHLLINVLFFLTMFSPSGQIVNPGGGGGSGTVGSGTAGQVAWYSASGTSVAGSTNLNDGGVVANVFTVDSTGGIQIGTSPNTAIFANGGYEQIQATGASGMIIETNGGPMYLRPSQTFTQASYASGGTHFGTDSFGAADPGADNVAIKGNLIMGTTTVYPTVRGTGTYTTATSDAVTVTGATASSNCTLTPTNATAAAAAVIAFVSSVTTNSVTISHAATVASGGTVNVHCTLN